MADVRQMPKQYMRKTNDHIFEVMLDEQDVMLADDQQLGGTDLHTKSYYGTVKDTGLLAKDKEMRLRAVN